MSDDEEASIYRAERRPAAVGGGNCLVCNESTEDGIAVVGTGTWAVAILVRLGWSFELATATVSDVTGQTAEVRPGVVYAAVGWDDPVTLLYHLCAGCGRQNGIDHVGNITGQTVIAPIYDEPPRKSDGTPRAVAPEGSDLAESRQLRDDIQAAAERTTALLGPGHPAVSSLMRAANQIAAATLTGEAPTYGEHEPGQSRQSP